MYHWKTLLIYRIVCQPYVWLVCWRPQVRSKNIIMFYTSNSFTIIFPIKINLLNSHTHTYTQKYTISYSLIVWVTCKRHILHTELEHFIFHLRLCYLFTNCCIRSSILSPALLFSSVVAGAFRTVFQNSYSQSQQNRTQNLLFS